MFERAIEPQAGRPYPRVLLDAWGTLTQPRTAPYLRLFGELHDLPAERSPWPEFRVLSVQDWLPTIERGLSDDGYQNPSAVALMIVATVRGLLADLTSTGELARTTAALEVVVDLLERSRRS